MDDKQLRAECISLLKLSGLKLTPEAMDILVGVTKLIGKDKNKTEWLSEVIEIILKQSLQSSLVDRTLIERAIKECANEADDACDFFHVISAFDVPKLTYSTDRKKFLNCMDSNGSSINRSNLLGDVSQRLNIFRERFVIIQQIVSRHELFAPSAVNNGARFNLQTVENLLSTPESKLSNCICLAMLTQLKEDKYFLEDLTGHVEVNLKETRFQTGLFVENSVVLAEGSFNDGIFQATAIGFPPIESAEKSRTFHGSVNFFGGSSKTSPKFNPKLLEIEQSQNSAALAFLSDVWLDDSQVLEKLRLLFTGFAECPPVCFVLCGRFLSKYQSTSDLKALKDGFKALVDIIQDFPNVLKHSQFIFVPSIHDPLLTSIFPKSPLPTSALSSILSKLPNCHLATNPCRVQYCSQEIVIYREDVIEKMCRNCVHLPSDVTKLHQHFARTILSQKHLAPLPLHVSPVNWSFDHSMRLYPLPDLVVCCDKYLQYAEKSHDCTVMNPGSFSSNKFVFQLYYPATRTVDHSAVPDE